MATKYRIAWRVKETGVTGHGDPLFTNQETVRIAVDYWNRRSPWAERWPEAVEVDDDAAVGYER